jgi:hypothetical protein
MQIADTVLSLPFLVAIVKKRISDSEEHFGPIYTQTTMDRLQAYQRKSA